MGVKESYRCTLFIAIIVALLVITGLTLSAAAEKVCIEDQLNVRMPAPDGSFGDYSHFKFYGAQQMGVRPKYLANVFLDCPREKDYEKAFALMPSRGLCEGLEIPGIACRIKRIELVKPK